ncbi:MAG: hypothetical protein EBV05_12730 [Cyanobacteria bacterium WB6_1B_304]|jgi:hypothetical protein|nr:hypothetical protein [Cyanobacteria bacterium WB6_1B_304]
MSQRQGFTGGFLLGAVLGGAIGGIIGALVSSGLNNSQTGGSLEEGEDGQLPLQSQLGMEAARQNLEDKIAQLNQAIEVVRQQVEDDYSGSDLSNHG